LKHFKKLGVPLGISPGRGKKIKYSREHLYQWIFCLECSQFAIDPTWIVMAMEKHWSSIYQLFERAGHLPSRIDDGDDPRKHEPEPVEDWFMVFSPNFMSGTWSGEPVTDPNDPSFPFFSNIQESRISETIARMRGHSRRIALINVTEITRQVQEAERNLPEHRRYLEELSEEILEELRVEQAGAPLESPNLTSRAAASEPHEPPSVVPLASPAEQAAWAPITAPEPNSAEPVQGEQTAKGRRKKGS
jgi:hypothetical protein